MPYTPTFPWNPGPITDTTIDHNVRYRRRSDRRWVVIDDFTSPEPLPDVSYFNGVGVGCRAHPVTRTVITYQDGTRLTGPWRGDARVVGAVVRDATTAALNKLDEEMVATAHAVPHFHLVGVTPDTDS